jgi:hypothetical protein
MRQRFHQHLHHHRLFISSSSRNLSSGLFAFDARPLCTPITDGQEYCADTTPVCCFEFEVLFRHGLRISSQKFRESFVSLSQFRSKSLNQQDKHAYFHNKNKINISKVRATLLVVLKQEKLTFDQPRRPDSPKVQQEYPTSFDPSRLPDSPKVQNGKLGDLLICSNTLWSDEVLTVVNQVYERRDRSLDWIFPASVIFHDKWPRIAVWKGVISPPFKFTTLPRMPPTK